ncbi:MAG: hypothetical protein RLY31_2645 [Bacteroidota bacterium]
MQFQLEAQTVFEIDANQSMLMTGKGPGQDATINPFQGEGCYAVIRNLGDESFSVRIQQDGKLIGVFAVKPKKTKKIKILVGQELYLDSNTQKKSKASVAYEKMSRKQ